jgi:hypothetical protein
MSYTNADGLRVLLHKDQGVVRDQGATADHQLRVKLDLTELGTTVGAADIDVYEGFIPAGAVITGATLVVTDAATSGGSATLTIGTYNEAGAAIDADGIDAGIALTAIDADNDVVRCDGAQVAGVGGKLAANAYVKAVYGTAAFTAGTAELVIEYTKVE